MLTLSRPARTTYAMPPCAHKPLCSRSRGRRGPEASLRVELHLHWRSSFVVREEGACTRPLDGALDAHHVAHPQLRLILLGHMCMCMRACTCACACACPRARAMCTRNVHVHAQCARTMCMRMRRSACACASHNVYLLGRGEDSKVWIVSRQWPVSDCFRSKELLHQPLQPDAMWPGACPSRIGSLARL